MLQEDLRDLVIKIISYQCEFQNIEIKKAKEGTPLRLFDTLSSFSNQHNGGTIVFGVDEKNGYEITGVYDPQDLQKKVAEQTLQMEPVVRPVFTVIDFDGKIIVSAEIPEIETNSKPCFYRPQGRIRGSYIRVGESDEPMNEYEVYSYEAYKKKIRDELRTAERSSLKDLDEEKLNEYFLYIKKRKENLSKHPKDKILSLQGMANDDKPTLAGLLVLGEYPQAFYPQLGITAMVVDGYELGEVGEGSARFIDNKRIEGTIPEMLEEAMSFIRRNTRVSTIINKQGKREDEEEYPLTAIREVVLNALIHRDYSPLTEDSPIRIMLFKDRIEVTNPGGLYGRLSLNDLGKIPGDTRNPYIAGALELLTKTENRFSGIPTIYKEMKERGFEPPSFENYRGNFKVTLFNKRHTKHSPLKRLSLKTRIQMFCETPRTREEIAEEFGFDSVYYLVTRYIRSMIEEGLIEMTIPEKPRSKFQKYQAKRLFI